MTIFKAVLDRFIFADHKNNIESYSKARTIAGVTLTLAVVLLINSVRAFFEQDFVMGVTVILAAILFLVALLILKYSKSYLLAGNYVIFMYWLLVTFMIVSTAGIASSNVNIFIGFAFTAFLLTGFRSGLVWGGVTLLTITAVKLMAMNGYSFREPNAQFYYITAIANVSNAIIMGAIFAFSSSGNLKKSVNLQKKAEKAAGEQNQLLSEANEVMNSVSTGDLTKRISIDLGGELGKLKNSINSALTMLGETISKVINSSSEILTGASQLSEVAQSLASGTSQQAASIEEVSSSINEIGSMANTNNENATQAKSLSRQSTEDMAQGNTQTENMLKSMSEINETSTNVSKVIKVIDEIAFQTNLLALNAAVEAARAGKYGKGFAVVAEEVRNLAARSSEAAKDTTGLIETSLKEVKNGVENADQTALILESFIENVEKVNDLVGEISSASQEQANAVNEVNISMNHINEVIQQNSSISEETAASSEELSAQAKSLQELMNNFVIQKAAAQAVGVQQSRPTLSQLPTKKIGIDAQLNQRNSIRKQIVLDENEFAK